MKGKLGILFMFLGTVLLGMALSLFLYNTAEARQAKEASISLLPQLLREIQEEHTAPTEPTLPPILPGTPEEFIDPAAYEMKVADIDGHGYIGFLSIPDLALELPVMSDWDYRKLQIAPCRYSGNLLSGDLVLMAHNYNAHFGKLNQLTPGARLSFTDMDGQVTRYEVVAVEVLPPNAIEDMVAGDFDLTLFTCTYGGRSRVTVRCDRVAEQ